MSARRLSVVIPTFDVAPIIRRTLDALTWADEVILVDSGSTDGTEAIAREYPNVRWEPWTPPGHYSIYAKVNHGFDIAGGEWLLRLDSDEVVTPGLAAQIREVVAADGPCDGYWIPSRTYFFGKWIRHGIAYSTEGINRTNPGHGYRKCLFRKGFARYPDHHAHEALESRGEWGYLTAHYDHYSHDTVSRWIEKMNLYTDMDTVRWSFDDPMWKRYHPWKTVAAVVLLFWDHYVRKKGYRDGMHGFMLAGLNAVYLFVERCKMWERQWRSERPEGGGAGAANEGPKPG